MSNLVTPQPVNRDYREETRKPYGCLAPANAPLPVRFLVLGALLRIADALEVIAAAQSPKPANKTRKR